jgi:hypothetical protein
MNKLELVYDNALTRLAIGSPKPNEVATGPEVEALGVAPLGSKLFINGKPRASTARGASRRRSAGPPRWCSGWSARTAARATGSASCECAREPAAAHHARAAGRRRLGEYHLLKKIAQGGMGTIYLAKRLGVGGFEKTFVIKCMLDSLADDQEVQAMFIDEARLAARLAHPNIAQIYDFGVIDGTYYIADGAHPGEDLRAIITRCASATRRSRAHRPADHARPVRRAWSTRTATPRPASRWGSSTGTSRRPTSWSATTAR